MIYFKTLRRLMLYFIIASFFTSHCRAQVISISAARTHAVGSTITIRGMIISGPELGTIRYIQDATGGVAIYSEKLSAVDRGDSIEITGRLSEYKNLLEIDPVDTFFVISSDNPLPTPQTVSLLQGYSEGFESRLIRIDNIQFLNDGHFFLNASAIYNIRDVNDTAAIWISSTSDICGMPIPSGKLDIVGIMSQYYNDYQLILRDKNDLALSDNGPLITSPVQPSNIHQTGFDIQFNTFHPGNTMVQYGNTPQSLNQYIVDTTLTISHSIAFEGLSPATIYYVRALSVSLQYDTSYSAIYPLITASNSSGDIKVYFNTPVDHTVSSGVDAVYLNGTMPDTVIKYINRAKYTLDIAIYSIDNNYNIIDAINDAYSRGVLVRVIMNKDVSSFAYSDLNIGSGNKMKSPSGQIPGMPGEEYGIMHDKFMIIDANSSNPNDPIVWTGSTNFTDNQLTTDPNNVIIIQDQSLALAFTLEFNEMWGGDFGPLKIDNTPHFFNIGNRDVQLYFSPSENVEQQIDNVINSTDNELFFSVLTFTRYQIAQVIRDRIQNKGILAAGMVEDTSGSGGYAFQVVAPYMHSFLIDHLPGLLHHKMLISDPQNSASDPTVLTGSYNWTNSAMQKNDENILIVHDQSITNQYYQAWRERYIENGGNPNVGIVRVENSDEKSLLIYPQPADNFVNLKFLHDFRGKAKLKVFDKQGKIIFSKTIDSFTDNILQLDTGLLPSGIYFLIIIVGKRQHFTKLMIMK